MGYRQFCDHCDATLSEGLRMGRKSHVSVTRYAAEGDDEVSAYDGSREFCDRACLWNYLNDGKEL